jgi:transcription elongation factor GreA
MSEPQDIVVSPETLERLKQELEELTTSGREDMSVRLLRARELGDLSENAEYHAAREAQGLMEARIRKLQHTIANAVVRVAAKASEEAIPGVIVKVEDKVVGETDEYLLAASTEEKIDGVRTVTTSSPLGKALLGKRKGDTALVQAPGGEFPIEILDIRPA